MVADPSLHHVIDGSGSVKGTRGGTSKLALGDSFSTSMRIGVPYLIPTSRRVPEARRIAWAHIGGWRWRYEFEPVEGDGLHQGDRDLRLVDVASRALHPADEVGPEEPGQHRQTLDGSTLFVTNTSSPL